MSFTVLFSKLQVLGRMISHGNSKQQVLVPVLFSVLSDNIPEKKLLANAIHNLDETLESKSKMKLYMIPL